MTLWCVFKNKQQVVLLRRLEGGWKSLRLRDRRVWQLLLYFTTPPSFPSFPFLSVVFIVLLTPFSHLDIPLTFRHSYYQRRCHFFKNLILKSQKVMVRRSGIQLSLSTRRAADFPISWSSWSPGEQPAPLFIMSQDVTKIVEEHRKDTANEEEEGCVKQNWYNIDAVNLQ